MRGLAIFSFCLLVTLLAHAQYAPQAGLGGSTAIDAGSSQFVGWATGCMVQRGWVNIANTPLGYASVGDSSMGVGAMDHGIVSLGDSGVATLTFAHAIIDGPGADFAVFENGFLNTANDSEAFLELAFVEVSSDGINYFRFPATSLTQINVQVGNGDYINACSINNLAGKYVSNFGTPFDLHELAGIAGLDINNVTHVRLVDVTGDIGVHGCTDNTGRKINHPYPTPFPSGGFDLDAVGVINQSAVAVNTISSIGEVRIYPNPVTDQLYVAVKDSRENVSVQLMSVTGAMLQQAGFTGSYALNVESYPAGLYYLVLSDANGSKWVEKVVKH